MSSQKRKKILSGTILTILSVLAVILVAISIHLYLKNVDVKAKEMAMTSDVIYDLDLGNLNTEGLYHINLKEELLKLVNNEEEKEINTITCHIGEENFVLEVVVKKDDEQNQYIEVEKIVEDHFGVNARISIPNVESIEYRTSTSGDETIIKLNTDNESSYFAMTEGTYYILGQDIESISYMGDHFYYVSYNPKYKALREVNECTKEVKASIKNFKNADYYYKYGKINFLTDFYQKLSTKTYTVKDRCEELQSNLGSE